MHSSAPSDPALYTQEPEGGDFGLGHSVLGQVLRSRKPHAAEQLFAVSDYDIVTELHAALGEIKNIVQQPNYASSKPDKSVVELVLSRITAAIRETNCIETYAPALVDLFETCLESDRAGKSDGKRSNAHEKLAAELLSTLFLYHSKASVMTVTIPATIKALDSGNADLVRNATSYLALGAVHNGRILSQYALQIIAKVLKGNLSLLRVISQIYPENKEPCHAHLYQLLRLLYNPNTDASEKLALLQLAAMVASVKPDLVVPHLSELDDFLLDESTCSSTLHVFMSLLGCGRVNCMTGQLLALRRAIHEADLSQHNLVTVVRILSVVARTNHQMAVVGVQDMVRAAQRLAANHLPAAFKEIEAVTQVYPSSVVHLLDQLRKMAQANPALLGVFSRIYNLSVKSSEPGARSSDSLTRQLPADPVQQRRQLSDEFADLDLDPDRSVGTLDRNTRTLAESYKNKDGSLPRHHSRSFNSMHRFPLPDETRPSGAELDAFSSATVPRSHAAPHSPDHSHTASDPNAPSRNPSRVAEHSWAADDLRTTTTIFPVLPSKHRVSGHLSGSAVKMIDEHQQRSRQLSGDAVPRPPPPPPQQQQQPPPPGLSRAERGDVVRQFVEHRRSKIRRFVRDLTCRYPIPVKCTVEGVKGARARMRVHFACQLVGAHCLCADFKHLFAFKTKHPAVWLHLMFLHVQVAHMQHTRHVLDQDSPEFRTLQNCWDCLTKDVTHGQPFVTLVTSAFPAVKEQAQMLRELQDAQFFHSFVYMAKERKWACFSCAHPERTTHLLKGGDPRVPILEGQLKEKKGKWKLFRRWHTKYFTLSSAALFATQGHPVNIHPVCPTPAIDLSKVKSVRSLSRGKKSRKSLQRAFEIFTEDDQQLVLKVSPTSSTTPAQAKDQNKAQEWFQCLQIAVAQAQRSRNRF